MIDQATPPASQADIAALGQSLSDDKVFFHAVQMTRVAMAIVDPNLPDSPLVYINPAFSHMTGYTAEEALGRNCRFMQGPDTDPDAIERLRQVLAARQAIDIEIYNYRKNGSGFWNALHLSPIYDQTGRLIYYFASQDDISAQKEAARRQAQRVESVSALASGVAHEFNNLMTVVVGNIERAAKRAADGRQKHYLDRISSASRRAGQLAGELLSLAQRPPRNERVTDLNELVRSAESSLAEVVGQRLRIRLDLAPEAVLVRLDAARFRLVLLNLVDNAADAMVEAGEIVVATSMLSAPAAAAALNDKAAVELAVTDTGAGISPEVAERATELFFTTKPNGTGLGLFRVLQFVDHCGGKLTIDSKAGRGTTVKMAFPRAT